MSDFNRNYDANRPIDPAISEPYRNEPYVERTVVVEERSSGFGAVIAIALIAAVAAGGYWAYNHQDQVRTAANDLKTSSTPASTSPAATPDKSVRPATPSSPPAQTSAQ